MSSQAFGALGASRAVVEALAEQGIHEPFPVQKLVIPDVRSGRDVLVKSPTGSGKTLAFGVPMVDHIQSEDPRPSALILVPTRELAGQVMDDLQPLAHARALSVAAVYGGVGLVRQAKQARRAHIVVATPGRLEDLMGRGELSLGRVTTLVLDEADRMLDMGFKPAVDRIVHALPKSRQTLFFSATLDGVVGKVAREYTSNPLSHEHTPKRERRADVKHRFVSVNHNSKLDALVRELRHEERGLTLVFVRTKRGADRLVKRLGSHDIKALAMHGNKTQSQREKALARFGSGHVDTLVATDVAARGLDIDDITHVINYDAPEDEDAYTHRVGRTGRAGRTGTGVTFVASEQRDDVRKMARGLNLHDEFGRMNGAGGGGNGNGQPRQRQQRRRRR
jgi:superfamily II DNA/RNA helicase